MALDDYDSMWIAYMCVINETGSEKNGDPKEKLSYYDVNTPQQCFRIGQHIVGSSEIGVPHFFYSLDAQYLTTMSPGWTLQQLADTIQTYSVPAQAVATILPNFSKAKMLSLAHTKLVQATHLITFANAAKPPAKPKASASEKQSKKTGVKK